MGNKSYCIWRRIEKLVTDKNWEKTQRGKLGVLHIYIKILQIIFKFYQFLDNLYKDSFLCCNSIKKTLRDLKAKLICFKGNFSSKKHNHIIVIRYEVRKVMKITKLCFFHLN